MQADSSSQFELQPLRLPDRVSHAPAAAPTSGADGSGARRPGSRVPWGRLLLALADGIGWVAALVAAVLLRFELDLGQVDVNSPLRLLVLAALVQVVAGALLRAYSGRHPVGSLGDAVDVACSMVVTGFLVFGVNFLMSVPSVPRSVPIIAMPIALVIAFGFRVIVRISKESAVAHMGEGRRVLIFGAGPDGQNLMNALRADPGGSLRPVGFVDDDPRMRNRRVGGLPVHGTREDIASAAVRFDSDVLLVTMREGDDPAGLGVSAAAVAAGIQVVAVPPVSELLRTVGVAPPHIPREAWAESVRRTFARSVLQAAVKRVVDVVLSTILLILMLPFLLMICVALAVVDRQVIYRAPRIGRYGRPFVMYKFATMRPGDSGPRVTRQSDPRITPLGGWLRDRKFNELPQLVNVIKGDMSIVGPRPEDPRYAAHYSPEQRRVFRVRPGLTSCAYLEFGDEQVYIEQAKPTDIEEYYINDLLPQKLQLELDYLRDWTVPGDLWIVARTIAKLVT